MKMISTLLITVLYTVFVQNLVMSAGLGMSEAIRLAAKPEKFRSLAVMITAFSVITGTICGGLSRIPAIATLPFAGRAAVYGGVLAAVYLIAALLLALLKPQDRRLRSTLGIAALNTLVYAVPFLNEFAAYSFAESLFSGLAAGAAFVLAAAVIGQGAKLLANNSNIPPIFRGSPALFLYVGLISLGFLGFSGTSLFQ
ncbi:MAG: hypothetical protein IK080_11900 [Clostridia bacterium]|nr:hypothetical protein [Clostridia bacterium]